MKSIEYTLLIPLLICGCDSNEHSQEQKTQAIQEADWHKDFGQFLPQAETVLEKIIAKAKAASEGQSKEMAYNTRGFDDNMLMEKFGLGKERIEWDLPYRGMESKGKNGAYSLTFDLPGYGKPGDGTKTPSVIIAFSTKSPELCRGIDKGSKVHVAGRLMSFGTFFISPANQKPDLSNERRMALFAIEDCVPQGTSASKPTGN